MSWGYFLDVDLTLPTTEWNRLKGESPASVPMPAGWWGFEDQGLEGYFHSAEGDSIEIGKALALFPEGESVRTVEPSGANTKVRVIALLDRGGDTCVAKPFAALLEGAKATATGYVALINDGSYSGEAGVRISAGGGALTRERIEDHWPIVEALGAQIYGDLEGDEAFDGEDP